MSCHEPACKCPSDPPSCAQCSIELAKRICRQEQGVGPKNCPTTRYQDLVSAAMHELKNNPEVLEFSRQASIQESEGYGQKELGYAHLRAEKPRIQEIIEFARKMNYQRICLAFCVGLRKEAQIVSQILTDNGFDVISVVCKAGGVSKAELALLKEQQIDPASFETMCNPILQALAANHHQSEFNVLLGLCVGHDSLFFKYADAYTTVLAVKDRLLAHNPLAAIYSYDSYYRYLKKPL